MKRTMGVFLGCVFRPTPDIRTFGQLWGHVAEAQFGQCAGIKGVPNPRQRESSLEIVSNGQLSMRGRGPGRGR